MEIQIGDSNHIFEIAIEIWISKLDLHHLTTEFVIWRHIKVHGTIWFCWSYIKGHHITISAEEFIIFTFSLIYMCRCSCPFQKIVRRNMKIWRNRTFIKRNSILTRKNISSSVRSEEQGLWFEWMGPWSEGLVTKF